MTMKTNKFQADFNLTTTYIIFREVYYRKLYLLMLICPRVIYIYIYKFYSLRFGSVKIISMGQTYLVIILIY